ncbi:GTPase [Burkholderia sp. LMU1-1-1.1]|uniref:GTPase n=1 Tax=Burkholderia sp. LMU1-1-1.1 TaxID=3135266 RepID=UPI003438023E
MSGVDVSAGAAVRAPVPTWLVTGARAGAREAAIAARLAHDDGPDGGMELPTVIILEGLSDGGSALAFDPADGPLGVAPVPKVLRIAPGCLHCSGNLVLRVTLNRVLRHPPARLYISLATAEHLELLRAWLSEPPYGDLLDLQSDIAA